MILVAAVATPVVVMSAATSAVVVTVAAPVALVVIVAVLMPAGALFIAVALVSAAAVHLGLRMPIGGAVVPRAATPTGVPTCRRLPLRRLGEAAVQLLKLLHVELPHHVVHHNMLLQIIRRWKGPLCVGGGSVRWRAELHRGPLSVGIRRICRTGIL